MSPSMRNKMLTAIRWMLGSLFCASGYIKGLDPVGMSVYVEKYLATYSLEILLPYALYIAIALAVVEVAIGEMFFIGVLQRYAASAATIFLSIFTIITLLSATILPIGDCGCFGDALHLTPWGTFLKNVVLLPMAIVLWCTAPKERFRLIVGLGFIVALPLAISIYSVRHLPIIDFMPYKESVNLRDKIAAERQAVRDAETHIVICRHPETGEVREFLAEDDGWYEWDLVDTRVERGSVEQQFADFRLYDASGNDCSEALLERVERTAWLCIRDDKSLDAERKDAISRLREQYSDDNILILTSANRDMLQSMFGLDSYSVDAMTLRSMIRSDVGVIVVEDGVIVDKLSFRDI